MTPTRATATARSVRRAWLVATLAAVLTLAGCGGGGDDDGTDDDPPPPPVYQTRELVAASNGERYSVDVYLPPESAGPRSAMPVVYALDGESWLDVLRQTVVASGTPTIVVAIRTGGRRNVDFVPPNACTPGGGGHAAYFAFITQQLVPYVEATFGGAPEKRMLFGHSHGGSFVLYALYAQAPGQHAFKAYLSVDASIGCMTDTVRGWDAAYAAAHAELPVRLHLSYASGGNAGANVEYATWLQAHRLGGLVFELRGYSGSHNGVVPDALRDGLRFGLTGVP